MEFVLANTCVKMARSKGEARPLISKDTIRLRALHEAAADRVAAVGACDEACRFCMRTTKRWEGSLEPCFLCPFCLCSVHASCAAESLGALATQAGLAPRAVLSKRLADVAASSDVAARWTPERVELALLKHPLPATLELFCSWCQEVISTKDAPEM